MDEKTTIKYFFRLFLVFAVMTVIGDTLLLFYNDTIQKVALDLAITGLGMFLTWMCYNMCNNAKNEMASKIFQEELLFRLDVLKTLIKK
jgi:hypothetical protein